MQSVTFRFRNFSIFLWYRFQNFVYRQKVLVSLSKKIGIRKSIGIVLGNFFGIDKSIGSNLVSLSKKIGIGKKYR